MSGEGSLRVSKTAGSESLPPERDSWFVPPFRLGHIKCFHAAWSIRDAISEIFAFHRNSMAPEFYLVKVSLHCRAGLPFRGLRRLLSRLPGAGLPIVIVVGGLPGATSAVAILFDRLPGAGWMPAARSSSTLLGAG